MKLASTLAVEVMHARPLGSMTLPDRLDISTDSRTLHAGQTFLALRGERFDGHAHVEQAIARGAAALILSDASAARDGVAVLHVEDTLSAYLALAGLARRHFHGKVVAITGSTGKTTVKEFLRDLLENGSAWRVLAPPANENNEVGVARLLLRLDDAAHDVVVVEMGARHAGDIETLVRAAQPDIGVLTNIGEAHLEMFGSRDVLAQTKWGLFSGDAQAILNVEDTESRMRADSLARAPQWFGSVSQLPMTLAAEERSTFVLGENQLVVVQGPRQTQRVIAHRLPGAHNRANVAAALAVALELGADIDRLCAALPSLQLPAGRYQSLRYPKLPRIIYDAYNANPASTIAALQTFAGEAGEQRIAVLSSMAELGSEAKAMHERVGACAAASVNVLLVGGDFAEALASGARAGGLPPECIVPFATNHDAVRWLQGHATTEDAVLLKGSRKYHLEEIIEGLRR